MSPDPVCRGIDLGPSGIWTCKIGETNFELPSGSDAPMRNAVEAAYQEIVGHESHFLFSGWRGELTEGERAVVEDRLPAGPSVSDIAKLLEASYKPEGVALWLRQHHDQLVTEEGRYELYAKASALAEGAFS